MRFSIVLFWCVLYCTTVSGQAVNLGRDEPPYLAASVSVSPKVLANAEQRCDMVRDLSEKCDMNYRLLGMRIMEEWQKTICQDKTFLRTIQQSKSVTFSVDEDGKIDIKGVPKEKTKAKKPKSKK